MRIASLLALVALASCDLKAGADGTATLGGTVAGHAIANAGASGESARTIASPTSTVVEIAVHVTSDAVTCGAPAAAGPALDLKVHVEGANVPAITAGDFSIGQIDQGNELVVAQAAFTIDGDSGITAPLAARSGTITFSTISPAAIAGRFDLVFVTGDRLTGTFDALTCGPDAGPVASPLDGGE